MDSVRERIAKLLRLAGNNSNEHEAAAALAKAQRLMEEYGVEVAGNDPDSIEIMEGAWKGGGKLKYPWHATTANAVARLYGCHHITTEKFGFHKFVGMRHQVEAAEETLFFVVEQIEELYKQALRVFDGSLTKSQRAELRASFKDAAAVRISVRVSKILNARNQPGKGLMVIDTSRKKAEELLQSKGVETVKLPTARVGFGSNAGFVAGGMIRIQKEVEQ